MLHGRHTAHLGNIERSILRHHFTDTRQLLPVVKSSRYHSRRNTDQISYTVSSFFCVHQRRHLRSFGSTRILGKQPPAMSPSPAKKQKVSANANEHLEQEPHEMSAVAGEVDRNPYPQGIDHESCGKHDTTTTQKDEEREKQKEGGEWRNQPPYRTSPENEHFDKKHTAECNCGRIRYWLSRDAPIASKYCHCKDCQSLHGRSDHKRPSPRISVDCIHRFEGGRHVIVRKMLTNVPFRCSLAVGGSLQERRSTL